MEKYQSSLRKIKKYLFIFMAVVLSLLVLSITYSLMNGESKISNKETKIFTTQVEKKAQLPLIIQYDNGWREYPNELLSLPSITKSGYEVSAIAKEFDIPTNRAYEYLWLSNIENEQRIFVREIDIDDNGDEVLQNGVYPEFKFIGMVDKNSFLKYHQGINNISGASIGRSFDTLISTWVSNSDIVDNVYTIKGVYNSNNLIDDSTFDSQALVDGLSDPISSITSIGVTLADPKVLNDESFTVISTSSKKWAEQDLWINNTKYSREIELTDKIGSNMGKNSANWEKTEISELTLPIQVGEVDATSKYFLPSTTLSQKSDLAGYVVEDIWINGSKFQKKYEILN